MEFGVEGSLPAPAQDRRAGGNAGIGCLNDGADGGKGAVPPIKSFECDASAYFRPCLRHAFSSEVNQRLRQAAWITPSQPGGPSACAPCRAIRKEALRHEGVDTMDENSSRKKRR